MKKLIISFLLLITATDIFASDLIKDGIVAETKDKNGRSYVVEIISSGFGNSESEAIRDALNEALKKVLGVTIYSDNFISSANENISANQNYENSEQLNIDSTINDDGVNSNKSGNLNISNSVTSKLDNNVSSSVNIKNIYEQSGGKVKTYETISVKLEGKKYKVQLRVFVNKPIDKLSDEERTRVLVIPFNSKSGIYNDFANEISVKLETLLGSVGKLAILDKSYSEQLVQKYSNFDEIPIAKIIDLADKLFIDYVITGNIENYENIVEEKQLFTVNKKLQINNQYTSINFNVVDVNTGVIKLSDIIKAETSNNIAISSKVKTISLSDKVAEELGIKVITQLFPIYVENTKGSNVVIGLGGRFVKNKDVYKIFKLGNIIKDSSTGMVIGYEETEIATVEIIEVQPKMSIGKIVSGSYISTTGKEYIAKFFNHGQSTEKVSNTESSMEKIEEPKKVKINETDW